MKLTFEYKAHSASKLIVKCINSPDAFGASVAAACNGEACWIKEKVLSFDENDYVSGEWVCHDGYEGCSFCQIDRLTDTSVATGSTKRAGSV